MIRRLRASVSAFALATACLTVAPAQADPPAAPTPMVGTAWYPEQWPESRWEADLALMEAAHIRFVRIAEFAWSTLEPTEGVYRFDWLARAVRAAERHHIAVVLGTPTAAPPAWLTTAYPDTLRTLRDGQKAEHGGRQQFDWSSPAYRRLAADIAGRMADRFGHDPDVIGWQIDNEYEQESYGPSTRAQFQDWLRAKYVTLDALNARWATSYWSETYQDWSQIPIPDRGNPGLMLNWREFVTDTWRSYQKTQLDILRAKVEARQKITTNLLGSHEVFDHYTVTQDLDFASWDDYVGTGHYSPEWNGLIHDMTRGLLSRPFWVMETQPGTVNWAQVNSSLYKGEVRAMAWNAVGHGAEAVGYWQWRSAPNGQEQYHGTLVGADGTPVPVYDEVRQTGEDFAKAAPALAGTTVRSEVAVINDYPSRWALSWQKHSAAYDSIKAMTAYYAPLRGIARSVDVVSDEAPLSKYKLVVAPALNLIETKAAANLIAYVKAGGHLVLGPRSGMKDDDDSLWQRQPGPLAELLGARVGQFYALDETVPVTGQWGSGSDTVWAEYLEPRAADVEVLMRYGKSNGWLDGQPAAVTRRIGKGRITYIGAMLDPATMKSAAAWMARVSDVAPVLPGLPEDVDVAVRSGGRKRVVILTNLGEADRMLALPSKMRDVLAGAEVVKVTLPRFGVAVLSDKVGPAH